MEKKKRKQDILILAATLFSMFFGAGNLIFPPFLGYEAGPLVKYAMIGFFLTGTGLPLLSVMASAKTKGNINELGEKVSPTFGKVLGIIVAIAIGPLMAIPRTGATTYETAIQPFFPGFSPVIFAMIYFGIAYMLVLNPSNLTDKIGKYLTPALFVLLIAIIVMGVINPMGPVKDMNAEGSFTKGFESGYQTMDGFTALLFGGMIVMSLKDRGYPDEKEQLKMTLQSGIIAVVALTVVYGGLGYLGSTTNSVIAQPITKVNLVRAIAAHSLKSFGTVSLSIIVSLACLTTAIGILSTVAQYFANLTNGKISYKVFAALVAISSAYFSVIGVEGIIKFSEPILVFVYPIVIVLVVLKLFNEDGKASIYKMATLFTTLAVTLKTLADTGAMPAAGKILAYLPFAKVDLAWIVPALIGGIIGSMIPEKTEKEGEIAGISN